MVLLSFSFLVRAPLPKVWNYFSRFENVAEWDPNVKSAKIGHREDNMVGTKFDLVTLWKGKESEITYEMKEYKENESIKLEGRNTFINATDIIRFKAKGQNTEVTYEADICLNHIFVLATPFIKSDLDVLCRQAKQGMQAKCEELFGK